MKYRIFAALVVAALALATVPALSGCSGDTYVSYTLYDSQGSAVRVDKLSANPSEDQTEEDESEQEEIEEGSYYIVTGYGGDPVDVVIPSEVNGVPVLGIGSQAFITCGTLKTLVIEEGVSSVGGAAFAFCAALSSVTLSSTIEMNYSMFAYCTALESIIIPDDITCISNRAFYGCSKLSKINADENSEINLPSSLSEIEYNAFYSCSALKGELVIPEGVTEITSSSFAACSGLTSVVFEGQVTKIAYAAFTGCSSLEGITLPDSVTYIGSGAFAYCTKITSFALPESIEIICKSAFEETPIGALYVPSGKGCYLYTEELATDDPETEEDEGIAAGSEAAKSYLYNYYYDSSLASNENAKGYLPTSELSDPAKAAEYITGDCESVYWYFVAV